MSVAYRAASVSPASGTGNLTPGVPSGTAADDVLLLFVNTDNAGTVAAPTGWTEASSSPATTTNSLDNGAKLAVFWKRAVSGETAPTVTDPSTTSDGASARIFGFSGCITSGNPLHVAASSTLEQAVSTTSTQQFLLDSSGDYNAWTHTANVSGSGGAITHNTTTTDADGSGSNGQIQHRAAGRTVSCTNTSSISITPTSYGVPSGAYIVGYQIVYAWRCSEYTTGASSTVRLSTPSGATNTFTATSNYADTTITNGASVGIATSASSAFTMTFTSSLSTGNSSTAAVSVLLDYVRVTFDYVTSVEPFAFPSLTTTQTNTMIVMAAVGSYATGSNNAPDAYQYANANLTSVTDVARAAAAYIGISASAGRTGVGTGFSATAQNIGASTFDLEIDRFAVPMALWTGALLGTDSATPGVGYSHSGWGIPLNSA